MTSTDTLLQSYRVCTRRRSLTGWYSPPVEERCLVQIHWFVVLQNHNANYTGSAKQFPSSGRELTAPTHVGCLHCLNRPRHLYSAFVLNKSTIIYSDDA